MKSFQVLGLTRYSTEYERVYPRIITITVAIFLAAIGWLGNG